MATNKPRITITLEPRAYEIVSRLSRAGGESMSQIVAGFLDTALPPMERLVVLLEQATAAPKEARAAMAASLADAERRILPDLLKAVRQVDLFLTEELKPGASGTEPTVLQEVAAGVAEGARSARTAAPATAESAPSTPVPVTRGSGPRKRGKSQGKPGVKHGVL